MDNEVPTYVLGVRLKRIFVVVAWFALSLISILIIPKPTQGNTTSPLTGLPFNLTFNMQGLLNILSLALAFSTVFSAFAILAFFASWSMTGQLRLFDSHAIWKKMRSEREVDYSEFTDAFFGVDARSTYASGSPYGPINNYSYTTVASFYIGRKRFNFSTRKMPGLIKFLEARIPKKNVDVDEFEDAPNSGPG